MKIRQVGVEEKVMQDKKQRREEDMTLLMMVEVEEKVMQDKKHRDDKIRLLMLKVADDLAQIALDQPLYDLVGMGLDQLNSSTLQN